eukprot:37729-Prymnesium_polylepis.2
MTVQRQGEPIDVLLATADHYGHGFFAIVERVVNQVLYARWAGLEPFVFVGERSFADLASCQQGRVPYFDATRGENVWEYFFEQPGRWRPGKNSVGSRPVRTLQAVSSEALFHFGGDAERPASITRAYQGDAWRAYERDARLQTRQAAHEVLGGGKLVRDEIRQRATATFAAWRAVSRHVLGVHIRGTDKIVARKVPPEAYVPFIDAWIAAHSDALVFVATDERSYLQRLEARFGRFSGAAGRIVTFQEGYSVANVLLSHSLHGYEKGLDVLTDALLLSKCDFLLRATSAVAEYAIWVNLRLHEAELDLQVRRCSVASNQ